MSKPTTVETEDGRRSVWPLSITIPVSVFGICSMLIVDHGLWNRRPVPNPKMAHYATTEDAAKAIGATVTPTTPKPALEHFYVLVLIPRATFQDRSKFIQSGFVRKRMAKREKDHM